MSLEITQLQHPDSIWTWSGKGGRACIWLPYLSSVSKVPRKKFTWTFSYQGGEIDVVLKDTDTIMLYGDGDADIPVALLDELNETGVILAFHRRNKARPLWIWPQAVMDRHDVLSAQIRCRDNGIRATYVARTLIRSRIDGMQWLARSPSSTFTALDAARSVGRIRQIEAGRTARYWETYFCELGLPGSARRAQGPVQAALDACSVFLTGILLRWTLFHRLAPTHGFLHEPSGYPALVYDLIEPYRIWMEKAVAEAVETVATGDEKKLIAASLVVLKRILQETVWVPAFQVEVRRKNLLHAIVLGLRAYLLGETKRFVIPIEGPRKGGRPIKASFAIPGATPN